MTRGPRIFIALCLVFLAAQVFVLLRLNARDARPRFVVIPHSVALSQPTPAPVDPVSSPVAGLTADDVVRGLIYLVKKETETPVTKAQAAQLLPLVTQMRLDRHALLTVRQQRHEANEASMEDALAIGSLLTNRQLNAVLERRASQPLSAKDWEHFRHRLAAD
ncbi:MAG: hypothetical protein P9L99_18445 [Candidatus Lernaella stagnicola]|nr:hypothetical protein [Candidatus Lernaella stagnicola]